MAKEQQHVPSCCEPDRQPVEVSPRVNGDLAQRPHETTLSNTSDEVALNSPSDFAEMTLVLFAPVAFTYSWHFYFTRMRRESAGWRNRLTLISLALASLAALLFPVMVMLMPRAGSGGEVGVDEDEWVESWHRPIFRTLLLALLLCLFGRRRLTAPIAIACVGTALFWLFSTAP